jgi:hypothetical protein
MANHESSTKATSSAMCHQGLDPCHSRFSWLHPNLEKDPAVQFACKTVDISNGARVIASILRQHLVDLSSIAGGAGASIKPLLNENDTQALAALLEVSLDTLCDMADSNLELIDNQALKGSRA